MHYTVIRKNSNLKSNRSLVVKTLKALVNLMAISAFVLVMATTVLGQPLSFQPKGVGGGGALFFPTINPANDNEFYVSCDMSELFHSTDFGLNYTQVDFTKLQVFNTSTYEFTNNANIAYCNFSDGNEGYPGKTINGGSSWSRITAYDVSSYGQVYALRANYDNPNQIIINSYGDIHFSNNGGNSFTVIRHRANSDVGLTLGGVFWDGANIYIGTNEGILYSTNSGTSFSLMTVSGMPAGQVIWSFAGAKSGGTTRFVSIAFAAGDTYNGLMPWDFGPLATGVYTMDNANGAWVAKSGTINFANDFVMYAAMARNDINTIYLGGNDGALGAPLIYKSANAGTDWTKVFKTTNNQNIITGWEGQGGDKTWGWSESCFGITVAPFNSNKVMFSSYSNVQVSADGGTNWRQAYVASTDQHAANTLTPKVSAYHSIGLENTTSWQVHWIDANTMMGCFSDIGAIRSTDAGDSWKFHTAPLVNTTYRVAQRADGVLFGARSNIHDMYQSTRLADSPLNNNDVNGKIVFSSDKGATWTDLHLFGHPVFWIALDPTNVNKMYASVIHSTLGGIYVTTNLNLMAASTWTKLSNPPRTEGHPASIVVLNDGKMVCTYSGRRATSSNFTASSGVFIYDPQSGNWTDVSDSGMLYWTKDIVLDPDDVSQNTWYVSVFSAWGSAPAPLGGLYKTTNRGQSWVKLTGTQFDRVTSITFDPLNSNQAYLTTETQGLWFSTNAKTAVPTWSLVTSYPFRQPERVFFNPFDKNEMWVSSFGNGMKVGLTNTPPLALSLISFNAVVKNGNSLLDWEVADHTEANAFTVLRSPDGKNFNTLAYIPAQQIDDYTAKYAYTDTTAAYIDRVYYRLRITKKDKSESYSRIVSIKNLDAETGIQLLGNPVANQLGFRVLNEHDSQSYFQIVNPAGQVVRSGRLMMRKGYQTSQLDVEKQAAGNYVLRLNGRDEKSRMVHFVKP